MDGWYPVRLTIHYVFLVALASVLLKPIFPPAYYNALPLLLSSVSLPTTVGTTVPTTSIHPHAAPLLPLLPVCPSLSFPDSRQFTSVSISRLYVCHYPSINPFNPCFLQLLVISSPFPLSLPVSTISDFSSEDKRFKNI